MSDPNPEATVAVDYTTATLPADIEQINMTAAYAPGERAAITFVRSVVHELSQALWVRTVSVDPVPGITVWITVAVAAQRIPVMLRWAAYQFHLAIDERRDPLHRSRLEHRADDLASLQFSPLKLHTLATDQAAERIAETIIYATKGVAWQRTGVHPDDLHFHCAECGDIDFQAATGGIPALVDYRCPSCRDAGHTDPPPSPATPKHAPRKTRRRSRCNPNQTEFIARTELPSPAVPSVRDGGTPKWSIHRVIERLRRDGYAISRGHILAVDEHHRETAAPAEDARIVTALLHQAFVRRGIVLRMTPTATVELLRLTPRGERLIRRWDRLQGTPAIDRPRPG